MKKIIVSIALFSATFSFAQQKQVKQAFLALEENNMATVSSKIKEADQLLANKTHLLEPELLEKYYIAKGVSLLKSGEMQKGAEVLSKITELDNATIYRGKDADKNKVYFVGKEAADASGINNLKEKKYQLSFKEITTTLLNPILGSLNTTTINAYNNKQYAKAGDGFQQIYYLLKSMGQDDLQYLYNSAVSYSYAKDNNKAIELFKHLIDKGYNGVKTVYSAKDKTTGKEITVDKSTWDLLKKNTQYSDFKSSTTPNIEAELFDTTIALLSEEKKYDDALAIVEKGLSKLPNNAKLLNQQGVIYAKLGKTDEFINTLKQQVAINPNDAIAWFNLGVLYSKSGKNTESIDAYKKAIQTDPKMANAYLNITYQIIGDDAKAIDEYNKNINKRGGKAKAEQILKDREARFRKALPYAEKLFELEKNSENAGLLKNIYRSVKNKEKYKELEKIEAELSK